MPLLDLHGEYSKALGNDARVFRIDSENDEKELFIPFWALDFDELADFLTGGITDDKTPYLRDKIVELKQKSLDMTSRAGVNSATVTVDTPVPFSLHQLWYDLIKQELEIVFSSNGMPALEKNGDAAGLIPPKFEQLTQGKKVGPNRGLQPQLDHLRSLLLDHRFDFLLQPGGWNPDVYGRTQKDLDVLFADWLGHDRPITIIDLSRVPSSVIPLLVGALFRLIYDALFWSRNKAEGGVNRPLLLVMEEAHRYLASGSKDTARKMASRIVKEGRKYGIGAMVVSQRPSEIDETILSQCGTFVALRLTTPSDRSRVQGTMPDSLAGLMDVLPVLRTGEAIITGEATRLPMRVRVTLPPENRRPDSEDPAVSAQWRNKRILENYEEVVEAFRARSL